MLDAAKNKLNHIAANTRKNSTYFFGAGHIGIKHVNFLCINDIIDAIIDDNPRKNGLYSGSANLPVIDKDTALQEEECLIIHPFENEKFGKICSSDSRIMRHQILSIDSLFR